jgi:hypothetical protein
LNLKDNLMHHHPTAHATTTWFGSTMLATW